MMTRRLRLVCALVPALQVLATSGEAGAWNQINDRVLEEKTGLGILDYYDLLEEDTTRRWATAMPLFSALLRRERCQ